MSTLRRAKLGWQRNDGQGNQTERIRGSHSFPENLRGSPDDFFCPRKIRPFFAPFALCVFAFNSCIKNPTPSHVSQSVAVVFGNAWEMLKPWKSALRWAAPPVCQPNRGKNLKMPKMPKSVQFRPGQISNCQCAFKLSMTLSLTRRGGDPRVLQVLQISQFVAPL